MTTDSTGNNSEHEYDIADILTISWNIFTKNYTHFFTIVFVIFFPAYLIVNYFFPRPEMFTMDPSGDMSFIWGMLIELFAGLIATLAVIFSVDDAYHNRPMVTSRAFTNTFERLLPALLTAIMAYMIILAGFVLIIPGIIALIFLTFFLQAVALRDVWSMDALRYSYYLVRNRFWKVLGYSIVFGLMSMLTGGTITLLADYIAANEVITSVFYTLSSLVSAFFFIVFAVFFMNMDDTKDFEFADNTE